jgi:hypothetical protein
MKLKSFVPLAKKLFDSNTTPNNEMDEKTKVWG